MNNQTQTSAVSELSTGKIVAEIHRHQTTQKRNPPTSQEWQDASEALAPLFDEMKRRQDSGRVIYA